MVHSKVGESRMEGMRETKSVVEARMTSAARAQNEPGSGAEVPRRAHRLYHFRPAKYKMLKMP